LGRDEDGEIGRTGCGLLGDGGEWGGAAARLFATDAVTQIYRSHGLERAGSAAAAVEPHPSHGHRRARCIGSTLRLRSRRTLAACCGAHVLHDGFADLLYVLFPIWQAAFGLSFAQVGMLKMLYSGSMAALQVPSSLLAERVGERLLLALGTVVAAAGFIVAGWTGGFLGLALCLMLSGAGASVQHPLGAALTSARSKARSCAPRWVPIFFR